MAIDAAESPSAFVFMTVLMLTFGVGRVAKETKTSVRPKSFFHLWMFAYLVLLGFSDVRDHSHGIGFTS